MFPDKEGTIAKLKEAFRDMLIMAGIACKTFDPKEDVYLRYFGEEAEHPDLVQCKQTLSN